MDWLLVGLVILLMVIYVIMRTGNTRKQPEVDEYQVDMLIIRIYYGRQGRSAIANLREFEKNGTIWVTVFETEPVVNEMQRLAEGHWVKVGKATVRCEKGTDNVVSWTRIE